jgi:hypothetical protein
VCLRPGTEIVIEAEVERRQDLLQFVSFRIARLFTRKQGWKIPYRVGRFRQINLEDRWTYHDAIEFPDGHVIMLTQLRTGQHATVLQLPAQRDAVTPWQSQRPITRPVGAMMQIRS